MRCFGPAALLLIEAVPVPCDDEDLIGTWITSFDDAVTWTFYEDREEPPDVWWASRDGRWITVIRDEVTSDMDWHADLGIIYGKPHEETPGRITRKWPWVPMAVYAIEEEDGEYSMVVQLGITQVLFRKVKDSLNGKTD